jgi:NDP-sugar pyrophosphorylase family protein
MIILIPMGGFGTRFTQAGYTINKACIPTTYRSTGKKLPMVVCAMSDIPGIYDKQNKIICVNRSFHADNGTEEIIKQNFAQTVFIHDHVLLDQAFGCFLAREFLQSDEELFIGACDNGFVMDALKFEEIKKTCDAIMISHTADSNIEQNPLAHSWAELENVSSNKIKNLSLKKTVSLNPLNDHASTGMFWFKNARVFLKYLEEMIWTKDLHNGKYYIDQLLNYYIKDGLDVHFFDVNYICWGTPWDYENYEKTIQYWYQFVKKEHGQS